MGKHDEDKKKDGQAPKGGKDLRDPAKGGQGGKHGGGNGSGKK